VANELIIDQSALDEVARERTDSGTAKTYLRISVDGGGCSGFQYKYEWAHDIADDDLIFQDAIVTDSLSLKYMVGSEIKFHNDMMGRMFQINNPAASSSCGCGTSFSI
tara:strand:- start:74200 stop:74523 length:324 start_codon:yes stop_codon:yes gene_type:complete